MQEFNISLELLGPCLTIATAGGKVKISSLGVVPDCAGHRLGLVDTPLRRICPPANWTGAVGNWWWRIGKGSKWGKNLREVKELCHTLEGTHELNIQTALVGSRDEHWNAVLVITSRLRLVLNTVFGHFKGFPFRAAWQRHHRYSSLTVIAHKIYPTERKGWLQLTEQNLSLVLQLEELKQSYKNLWRSLFYSRRRPEDAYVTMG